MSYFNCIIFTIVNECTLNIYILLIYVCVDIGMTIHNYLYYMY